MLEQVYPALDQAIADRISMRLGGWARILKPLLSWQIFPRPGVGIEMRPLDHAQKIAAPKLFIGGVEDRHTTPREMREMFDAAPEPKELWMVPKAEHVDLCQFATAEYEDRVVRFFARRIGGMQ